MIKSPLFPIERIRSLCLNCGNSTYSKYCQFCNGNQFLQILVSNDSCEYTNAYLAYEQIKADIKINNTDHLPEHLVSKVKFFLDKQNDFNNDIEQKKQNELMKALENEFQHY